MSKITFSPTFQALLKEAEFTKEMLGSGATQVRRAGYTSRGAYFQAFTSLSTGLERIGKLCLMLDYYIDHGRFPDPNYMKREIGHRISLIYGKSAVIIAKRSLSMDFLKNLNDPIHRSILPVLSEFAEGDRYSNINLHVSGTRQNDPVASWHKEVDQALFDTCVRAKRKKTIRRNASAVAALLGAHADVLHTSETGDMITSVEDASYTTGMYKAVAPYRQLYVLQVIRYWVELLMLLQYVAMRSSDDIPHFGEVFALIYNGNSYLRSRRTWESL